jgi:hypothetical protein
MKTIVRITLMCLVGTAMVLALAFAAFLALDPGHPIP